MTYDGHDLYPNLFEKAAILCFALVKNHPFIDGNKRIGHAAMETFLVLNGFELNSPLDEQENAILKLAGGELSKEKFIDWVKNNLIEIKL